MKLSIRQKRKLRVTSKLVFFGIAAGLFFVSLSDGFSDPYPLINGAAIGVLIALVISWFEFNIYERTLRKQKFITVLLVRSVFYLTAISIVIIVEIGSARMLKERLDLGGLLQNDHFRTYMLEGEFITSVAYAFCIIVIVNFTRQVSRKLGQGIFASFITGAYFHPKEVYDFFMFINIQHTQEIIESMGRMKFHKFLNEVVFDITEPIISHKGIIYQYVEGQMVVVWNLENGCKDSNVVRCFFDIVETINLQFEKYQSNFHFSPKFNAALHVGSAVKGEIGYVKSEIVYHGDVLNTTSRILDTCTTIDKQFLISQKALEMIDLPNEINSQLCGDIVLKGKKYPLVLFALDKSMVEQKVFA